jgi:hypothetical protein
MPLHIEGPDAIEAKLVLGAVGSIFAGIVGGVVCGLKFAMAAALSAGLVGVIAGAFRDGDYDRPIFVTSPQMERAWTVIGYTILIGLGITLFGILLSFFVPDWRPFLVASLGIVAVIIALSYGGSLAHR